jgi:tRNA nucleotidyltransferase/poly(A) polymerase
MLENVSEERIWSEFRRVLEGENTAEILERMRKDGMLSRILPGWDAHIDLQHLLATPKENTFACRLVLLASQTPHERWRRLEHDLRILKLSNQERGLVMNLHRLLGHLPSDISEYRRYRADVDGLVDSHLSIEEVLNPVQVGYVREALSTLAPLQAGNEPLVDGHLLANVSGLSPGRRLGRLKEWLFRIQVEQDLPTSEEVLAHLDQLDWESTDPESWPDMRWP